MKARSLRFNRTLFSSFFFFYTFWCLSNDGLTSGHQEAPRHDLARVASRRTMKHENNDSLSRLDLICIYRIYLIGGILNILDHEMVLSKNNSTTVSFERLTNDKLENHVYIFLVISGMAGKASRRIKNDQRYNDMGWISDDGIWREVIPKYMCRE